MPPATRRSPRLAAEEGAHQQEQATTATAVRRRASSGSRRAGSGANMEAQLPQSSSPASASTPPRRVFLLSGYEIATFALIVAYCLVVLFREGDRLCRDVLRELPAAALRRAGLVPVDGAAGGASSPASSPSLERALFGSPVNDLSDAQWRSFRGSAPLLAVVLAAFVLLSRAARAWDERHPPPPPSAPAAPAAASAPAPLPPPPLRLGARTPLLAALGVLLLVVLHGAAAVFPLALCLASFAVALRCAGRPRGLWIVWAWHAAAFFAARVAEGFPFAALPLGLGARLAFLDAHRGPLRWHIHYNLLLLRMVSHAADLHWSRLAEAEAEAEAGAAASLAPAAAAATAAVAAGLPLTRRRRRALERAAAERHLPARAYGSPWLYLAYCLYPPLYIAGPIATFNSLGAQILPAQPQQQQQQKQQRRAGGNNSKAGGEDEGGDGDGAPAAHQTLSPLPPPSLRDVLVYAARAAACWLVLEAVTHRLFYWAIARNGLWRQLAAARWQHEQQQLAAAATAAAASGDAAALAVTTTLTSLSSPQFLPPLQMALVPWWVMLFAWLKFLALWRFFRAFALADGSSAAPENLTRCICNNYDVAGFWQNWHASYNRWLVRYMYVPLGGSRSRIFNVWPIFTFVAIWHDLEIQMLAWAWLMALLVLPEALVKWIGNKPGNPFPDKGARSFRYACAAAGAANAVLLMAANMVGFVFGGLEGVGTFLRRVVADAAFGPVVAGAFFCGVQLMFALRDWEAWREGREREEEAALVSLPGGGGAARAAAEVAMAALPPKGAAGARRRGGTVLSLDEAEEARALLLAGGKSGGGGGGGAV